MTDATCLGKRLVPALLVRDMQETLEFYQELGFHVTGCHPDQSNSTWAEVKRDSVVLQFHTEPPRGTPPAPVCSDTFYILPDSVAALADEFRDKLEFAWGSEVMDYGIHEFGIQDLNGYYVAFAEPA